AGDRTLDPGARRGLAGHVVMRRELLDQELDHRAVVIDYQAARELGHAESLPSLALRAGKLTMNSAPPLDWAVIVPPCSLTIVRTTASPRPVPPSEARVVKNGSNSWACISGGMPGPVSRTIRRTWPEPAGASTRTVIRP